MNIGLCSWLASQSWLEPWPLSRRSSVLSLSHLALADLLPGPFGCEGNQIYINYKVKSTISLPPCEHLCKRYCSNKQKLASNALPVDQARLERRVAKNVDVLPLAFNRVLNVAYVHVHTFTFFGTLTGWTFCDVQQSGQRCPPTLTFFGPLLERLVAFKFPQGSFIY